MKQKIKAIHNVMQGSPGNEMLEDREFQHGGEDSTTDRWAHGPPVQ